MVKKGLVILFLLVVSLSVVSAANCWQSTRTSCTGANKIVMGLSGATNAHGEKTTTGDYLSVLCCDFGTGLAGTTCNADNSNRILWLSGIGNAHAEIPDANPKTYSTPVCYENVECVSDTTTCRAGYSPYLSLSGPSNAHLAWFQTYPVKICCRVPSVTPVCGNGGLPEDGETCDDGCTSPGVPLGCDALPLNDGDGCSTTCQLEVQTYCIKNSITACEEYDIAHCIANDECHVGPCEWSTTDNKCVEKLDFATTCGEYTQQECVNDPDGVIDGTYGGSPIWLPFGTETGCEAQYTQECYFDAGINPNEAPQCNLKQTFVTGTKTDECTIETPNNCNYRDLPDGSCSGGNDFIKISYALLAGSDTECPDLKDKSKIVPCPARAQLPFFDVKNIVLAGAVILLIYIFIRFKKRG